MSKTAEKAEPVEEEVETIDAEAEEVTETEEVEPNAAPPPAASSTEVVVSHAPRPGTDVIMPMNADQVVAGMEAYQELLPRLLSDSDYQEAEQGKRFVKKSGWRKIARAFNLSLTKVSITVERDDDGNPLRAEAVFRATAPNGQVQDGDGYCSVDEPRFDKAGGRRKIENDLRATATTRAKNRAISDLVGMGEVSAEEVDGGGARAAGNMPKVERGNDEQQKAAKGSLGRMVGADAALVIWTEVCEAFGGIAPRAWCKGVVEIEAAMRANAEAQGEGSP